MATNPGLNEDELDVRRLLDTSREYTAKFEKFSASVLKAWASLEGLDEDEDKTRRVRAEIDSLKFYINRIERGYLELNRFMSQVIEHGAISQQDQMELMLRLSELEAAKERAMTLAYGMP